MGGGEGLDNLDDLTEALPEEEEAVKDDDDDMDFNDDSFADKKKKKKKKKVNVDDLDDGDADKENEGEGDSADPWSGSDRDYLYDELLQRVFGIMRDKNPDMVAGEKKKFVMRPPQVVRVGSKKTAFVNFTAPAAAEEDIDLESFGKKKKKKKVTIEDDEDGGGEKDDGAADDDIDLESSGKKKKKKKK